MNKLCDVLIRNISGYLDVKDILNFELSAKRRGATPVEELIKRYHREPKHKEVIVYKKGRNVKYILDSYFTEDRLYTKVTSWYGRHKIISVVSHNLCTSTIEANMWTFNAFTQHKTSIEQLRKLRSSTRVLLKLHI
tara:strand:- start:548 stop:955 length:408 start_codon:yes stop_codon:yes gene_type:complete